MAIWTYNTRIVGAGASFVMLLWFGLNGFSYTLSDANSVGPAPDIQARWCFQ